MRQFIHRVIPLLLFLMVIAGDGVYGRMVENIDQANREELRVYPNPVNVKQVTIDFQNTKITDITLINIVGKELIVKQFNLGVQKYLLQLNDIPNGIYFLRIKSVDDKIVVRKLVVSVK